MAARSVEISTALGGVPLVIVENVVVDTVPFTAIPFPS